MNTPPEEVQDADSGTMILEQLQQLQQQTQQQQQLQQEQMLAMMQQQQQMRQQMYQMQQQLIHLETAVASIAGKADIRETNALARFENNLVSRGDHDLVLPLSYDTGTTVVDCPNTANEILQLGAEQVNHVLKQLRLPTSGRVTQRTRRLLKYMGVTAKVT